MMMMMMMMMIRCPCDWFAQSRKYARSAIEYIVLQCSRLSDDDDSVTDSDAEFDSVLKSTTDVINDVTAADAAGTEDTVISAEQVISEIESMLEVGCLMPVLGHRLY